MEENLSHILENFSIFLNDENKKNDLKSIISSFEKNNEKMDSNQDFPNNLSNMTNNDSNSFNIDIDTIIKIKKIIDSFNTSSSDNRTILLESLKPYLRSSKQSKVDEYIKILKIVSVLENTNIKDLFNTNE